MSIYLKNALLENPDQQERLYQMSFLHNYAPTSVFTLTNEAFKELYSLSLQMEKESRSDHPDLWGILHSYLDIFLLKCRTFCNEAGENMQVPTPSQALAKKFYQLLDNHFQEWHQVKDYASALCVTPRYLNKSVTRQTGKNCSEIISNRILMEAMRLVKYTGFSMKEIAYFLHFEDPAYFSRYFKKHTGMTPVDYKKSGMQQV